MEHDEAVTTLPHRVSWDGRRLSITRGAGGTGITYLQRPFMLVDEGERASGGVVRHHIETDDGRRVSLDVDESDHDSLDALRRARLTVAVDQSRAASSGGLVADLQRARLLATVVEALGWLFFVAGVIAAIAVADRSGPGHPYVWQGIFVVLATTLLSALAVMLAAYVHGRTE
jgi:hypothetical protein